MASGGLGGLLPIQVLFWESVCFSFDDEGQPRVVTVFARCAHRRPFANSAMFFAIWWDVKWFPTTRVTIAGAFANWFVDSFARGALRRFVLTVYDRVEEATVRRDGTNANASFVSVFSDF